MVSILFNCVFSLVRSFLSIIRGVAKVLRMPSRAFSGVAKRLSHRVYVFFPLSYRLKKNSGLNICVQSQIDVCNVFAMHGVI